MVAAAMTGTHLRHQVGKSETIYVGCFPLTPDNLLEALLLHYGIYTYKCYTDLYSNMLYELQWPNKFSLLNL